MAVLGVTRRRDRRASRKRDAQQQAYNDAFDEAEKRNRAARREAQEEEVFATTEGEGIMEGANISLGYNEEEEEELLGMLGTGLVV